MLIFHRTWTAFALLLSIAVVLALATVSEANAFAPQARDHVVLHRMIKKRSPASLDVLQPPANPGPDPPPGTPTGTPSATPLPNDTTPPDTSKPADNSATPSSAPSTTPTSTPGSSTSSSETSSAPTSSSSSSSSSSTLSSEPSSTPSSTPPPSTTPSDTPTPLPSPLANTPPPQQDQGGNRVTATVTDSSGATPTDGGAEAASAASSSSKVTKTTLIVIVTIAGSIGAIFVGWTIIRKWKFKPSSNFEDRMQPIDWQPTTDDRDAVPGLHRAGSASSNHSSNSSGHGNGGYAANGSEHSRGSPLQPIPDHDFTAGPPALAPVGGYADLARGPSPQPQMQQLNRGPSLNHGEYESYGVPLHHSAYDYNIPAGMRY